MTHTYSITGMTCNNCVAKVKSELLKTAGVSSADVQLQQPQATITMDKHLSLSALQEAVHKASPKYTIAAEGMAMNMDDTATDAAPSYYPIFLIFGYIAGISLLVQYVHGSFNAMQFMSYFMGGFFLVFSFFKLLNLSAFAEGYRTYDVVAKAIPAYGFIYPFIELALGIAFIGGFSPLVVNIITILIMAISSIGVIQSLVKKTTFQCACLGTVIKLPLSKVTLFEDLLMVAMSGVAVIFLWK